jgi:hypothetical protein
MKYVQTSGYKDISELLLSYEITRQIEAVTARVIPRP